MPRLHPHSAIGRLALTVVVSLVTGHLVRAQVPLDSALPTPRLATLLPCGGKVGTVVEVTFTGQDIDEPQQLLFSQPGIKAEPIVPPPPPPPDPKKPPMPPPPLTPITKFKVTIPADTPLGIHDVRLIGRWGVSNPRAFVVGDLAEVLEKEPNNDVDQAQRVELNSTINGNLASPTDVDYYVFAGKKGQRVVFSCLASTIDSRFHPGLEVYDSKGKLLAFSRDYNSHDALADVALPDNGDYFVRLYEFTHTQGTAEHFYRLSITTAPWIDAIHPCVVEPGKSTQLTVYGRNLPGGKPDPSVLVEDRVLEKVTVTVNVPADPQARQQLRYSGHVNPPSAGLDGFEYRLRNDAGSSNPFLLTYATAPVVLGAEESRTAKAPQEITLPCEIAGRIQKRHERDWYAFAVKKGETWNIEVLSERLGAPTAMYFVLRNPASNQDLYESPDNQEPVVPKFYSRGEDPAAYRFTAPADGKYLLLVNSRVSDTLAGVRHFYRVRITPEQPDFHLVAMPYANTRPDSSILHPGGSQGLTVLAFRRGGFTGDIALAVEGLPAGVTCPPQVLGGGLRETTLVFSIADNASPAVAPIKIKGTATIAGQSVVREARSASIVWQLAQPQVPTPTITRLDRGLVVAVRDKALYKLAATVDKPILVHGDKGMLKVTLDRVSPDFKNPLTVQVLAAELPPGLTVNNNGPMNIAANQKEVSLSIQVNPNVQPGVYNLVLRSFAQIPFQKDPKVTQKPALNVVQPSLPVSLTIAPKTVGTLALAAPAMTVKVGAQAEVIVKVTRLHNYAGEYKVEVVLPPNIKGVAIDPVVIPAGQDEAKLVIRTPADAMPGNRAGLIVRATAQYNGTVPTTQDAPTQLSINIIK